MKRTIPAALAAAALVIVTAVACASKSTAGAPATFTPRAQVSSALANPTVSADLTAAEQQLLASLQANFSPAHPVTSVQTAIRAVFPHGDASRIEGYGARTFTLAVVHPLRGANPARDKWAQGVVIYAEAQGAYPASAAPSAAST